MRTAFYMHGFGGAPEGKKVEKFREILDDEGFTLVAPTIHWEQGMGYSVDRLIEMNIAAADVVIGSSLGGGAARWWSYHTGTPAILVNPALRPDITLEKYIDTKVQKALFGRDLGFKRPHFESFFKMAIPASWIQHEVPTLALFDEDDGVLDSKANAEYLKATGAQTVVFPGGSHAFEHMDEADKYIREFLRYSVL